jgi:fatty-acid desaturase
MFVIFPLMHLVVLYGIVTHEYWYLVLIAGILMFYPILYLGESLGYHRMFGHKAFKSKKWYPYLSAFLGSISFYGDPLRAALVHRLHHKHVDTELDPHSPKHGRFHAYIGWLYSYTPQPNDLYIIMDLMKTYKWLVTYSKIEWLVFTTFHISIFLISPTLFLIIMTGCLLAVNNGLLVNAYSHEPTDNGWVSTDKIWLSKYINPTFLHKQHHAIAGKWDYSDDEVTDFTRWFVKNWLAEDSNSLK